MAEGTELKPIGEVIGVEGVATAVRGEFSRELAMGSPVYEGEVLKTASGSNVEIRFEDNTLLAQGPNAELSLDDYVYNDDKDLSHLLFEASVGAFRITTGVITEMNPEGFQIGGPLSTLGIRGTIVTMDVKEDGTTSIGAEELHERFVVVQSDTGQERLLMNSGKVVDLDTSGQFSPIRSYTPEETALFKSISTQSVLVEQQMKDEEAKDEDEKEEEGVEEEAAQEEGGEENAEESTEEGDGEETEEGEKEAEEGEEEGEEEAEEEGEDTEKEKEEEQGEKEDAKKEEEAAAKGEGETKDEPKDGPNDEPKDEGPEGGEQDPTNEITDEPDPFDGGEKVRLDPKSELEGSGNTINGGGDGGVVPDPDPDPEPTEDSPPDPGGQDQPAPPPGEEPKDDDDPLPPPPNSPPPGDGIIYGTAGDDTVNGTAGNDKINGLAGNDQLNGLDGNDTFIMGSGDNAIDGGLGIDVLDYSSATVGMSLNMTTPSAVATDSSYSDTFSNIESVIGTNYADTLNGDAGHNTLLGGDGNDNIFGDSGNDFLGGGGGNDIIDGGSAGVDTLDYSAASGGIMGTLSGTFNGAIDATAGGEGTDVYSNIEYIAATDHADTFDMGFSDVNLDLGGGNDSVQTGGGSDSTVSGGAGTDSLSLTGGGNYNLDMGAGTATTGTSLTFNGFEAFSAGAGTDTVDFSSFGSAVSAVLSGSAHSVTSTYAFQGFEYLKGSAYNDTLEVGAGDTLDGMGGNDVLYSSGGATIAGGTGDDTFIGSSGSDVLNGEIGTDSIDYSSFTSGITGTLSSASMTVNAGAYGTDTLSNIEQVSGTNHADTFDVGNVSVSVFALADDDVIHTQFGASGHLDGGTGTDTLNLNGGSSYSINIVTETATGFSGGGTISFDNIEVVNASGSNDAADFSSATSGVNAAITTSSVSYGGTTYTGIDDLVGSNYNDTLQSGTGGGIEGRGGDDWMVLNQSNFNNIDGGVGEDTLVYGAGGMTLTLSSGSPVADIEAINMDDSASNGLNITYDAVLSVTDASNQLVVVGSAGSSITIGGGWTDDGSVTVDGVDSHQYSQSGATIIIDDDITVY